MGVGYLPEWLRLGGFFYLDGGGLAKIIYLDGGG